MRQFRIATVSPGNAVYEIMVSEDDYHLGALDGEIYISFGDHQIEMERRLDEHAAFVSEVRRALNENADPAADIWIAIEKLRGGR